MSNWPQYTWIVLGVFGLGIALARDGEPRKGNQSFWATLISTGLGFWLLYMGGFFASL